jgi:hypothetical protein
MDNWTRRHSQSFDPETRFLEITKPNGRITPYPSIGNPNILSHYLINFNEGIANTPVEAGTT